MTPAAAKAQLHMDTLSRLMFRGYSGSFERPLFGLRSLEADVQYLSSLSADEFSDVLSTADKHHVLVRALRVVEQAALQMADGRLASASNKAILTETARVQFAVEFLEHICEALESAGCPTVVIKSLDHWPDLGSD